MTLVEWAELFLKKYMKIYFGRCGVIAIKNLFFFLQFFKILYLENTNGKFVYNVIYQQRFP